MKGIVYFGVVYYSYTNVSLIYVQQ